MVDGANAEVAAWTMGSALPRRGFILILSSPSGAGKTSLTKSLRSGAGLELDVSISVTTRARRSAEVDGQDYRFIDTDEFERLRDHDDLLEWAEVHGNFYGTPRGPVERSLEAGTDMIFDIDYQGAQQVRAKLERDVVSVFILPPSMAELQSRLERRAQDSRETIERRLVNARREIEHWDEYDYVIVNEDLNRSFDQLHSILVAERLKRERRVGLEQFVGGLLG